ncbi:Hypothetical protein CINCED_3A023660 [Cinara cedri]|uniref:Uncharacterized protein n=1 Tax=Cinara cedri TaxID=506608 RepID=A0A5E4MG23_9HEMI|nr:Hypothetical protein CINCED_3A023660 [Cinara cedri]
MINLITDEIMDDLQCLYIYYANNDLTETRHIVNHMDIVSDGRKKNLNLNIHLVFRYLDVSLMTLATFINTAYQPPGWMVLVVLYLEKVLYLFENMDLFKTETTKILKIIKTAFDLCNPNIEKSKILDIPLENLQVGVQYKNIKLYTRWQREITGMKIIDPTRSEYVSNMYSNLIQIEYLLDFNAKNLNYLNPIDFHEFHPSKWLLFTSIELKEDAVETL